jgi:hypothetical protein
MIYRGGAAPEVAHFIVSGGSSGPGASPPRYWAQRGLFRRSTYAALSASWIIINIGGGPTDDKPPVTLETPRDSDRDSSFLERRLTPPVLTIGGAEGIGEGAANTMKLAGSDVQSLVIPGSGHCLEELPRRWWQR